MPTAWPDLFRRLASSARHAGRDVVDLIYPTDCAACEAFVDGAGPLCRECDAQLCKLTDAPACPACAKPLAQHGSPCPYCEGKGEPHFDRIVRLGVYADPIRHLVYRMKYHGQWTLAEFLARRLLRCDRVKDLLADTDCVVPVPLHFLRQLSRGFNQSEVLARRLSRRSQGWSIRQRRGPVVTQPLVRVRHTDAQIVVHSRTKREENLRDAFGLTDAEAVRGRRVLVVDDITTTGATLLSVARALAPAKPASLCALVVAIADPKGTEFSEI